MIFTEWCQLYKTTVEDIGGSKNVEKKNDHLKECFKDKMDPQWAALIDIQECVRSYTFSQWKKYVDKVLVLIVSKDSNDIEDLPYHNLWDKGYNPLIIGMYGVFNSTEDLDDTELPKNAQFIWKTSKQHQKIKNDIESILKTW
jgi:hypothetical protein